ncbi:MAG: hypothetical protein Q9191_004624 [Dirinaria sp. TL-2023a]
MPDSTPAPVSNSEPYHHSNLAQHVVQPATDKSVAQICTADSNLEYTRLFGGENSGPPKESFEALAPDHSTPVIGFTVYQGWITGYKVVTGLRIFWADGTDRVVGWSNSRDGQKAFAFRDKETIDDMYARSGWYVDKIEFKTNLGRPFELGDDAGVKQRVERLGNGILVGFRGTVEEPSGDSHIGALGFIFQKQ